MVRIVVLIRDMFNQGTVVFFNQDISFYKDEPMTKFPKVLESWPVHGFKTRGGN